MQSLLLRNTCSLVLRKPAISFLQRPVQYKSLFTQNTPKVNHSDIVTGCFTFKSNFSISFDSNLSQSFFQNTLLSPFNKPTIGVRWSATGKTPKPEAATKKVVGYWLLGCSGMVFVAVVLGVYSIETVLEEVTKLTVKK